MDYEEKRTAEIYAMIEEEYKNRGVKFVDNNGHGEFVYQCIMNHETDNEIQQQITENLNFDLENREL